MGLILSLLVWLGRAAALLLALGCAGLAVAGQGGRWDARLDLLNHAAPVWLAGAVAAGALWAALGRWNWVTPALALVGALASGWLMAPEIAAMVRLPPRASGEILKIVEFNVWARNADPAATARWILAQDADFVVLEEATTPIVQRLRARYPYGSVCGGDDLCSTMILSSRRPLAEENKGRTSLTAVWGIYPDARGPITIVGAHHSWPWPLGKQQAEGLRLALMLGHFPKARMILAGDFNSTPWSFALRRQDKALGLERRTLALFSWPARNPYEWPRGWRIPTPLPLIPIDQVYAGSGWRTLSVRRGPRLGSDHYPVVVTLTASP